MKYYFGLWCIGFLQVLSSCQNSTPAENSDTATLKTEVATTVAYTYAIFPADTVEGKIGYGYDILQDGKRLIHQPTIPAISGLHSFDSEADAITTAEEVIRKLKKGEMPPTLSESELKTLGVIK